MTSNNVETRTQNVLHVSDAAGREPDRRQLQEPLQTAGGAGEILHSSSE